MKFLLFKFHRYFDGLIGLDVIKQYGIKLDFSTSTLETNKIKLPLLYKPNYQSPAYKIPPRSKMIIKIPVDIENGEIYIKPVYINEQVVIPEGLYTSRNWHAIIEIINFSNKKPTAVFEQPVKVEQSKDYKIEINHTSISSELTTNTQNI